jgi:hypothetical protein
MTADEIRELASRREGTDLDFKLEQYDWTNDGNHELAKDLMAMANKLGPYSAPAHILIGVKEVLPEKTGEIVGIDPSHHLDDAKMQEKVKRLLNRQPKFSYAAVGVDGMSVGVFEIGPGGRPFYALKDAGSTHKLVRFQVLHRIGTATDVASGDEIVTWSREDDPMDLKLRALELEERESKLALHARALGPGTQNSGDSATHVFHVVNDGEAPLRIVAARVRWRVDTDRLRVWLTNNGGRLLRTAEIVEDTTAFPRDTIRAAGQSSVTATIMGAALSQRLSGATETECAHPPPAYQTFAVGCLEVDLQGNTAERKRTIVSDEFPWRSQ